MYGVRRLAEATVDLYEDGSRYVESGLDRIGRKLNRGVTALGIGASILAGVACSPSTPGYTNIPSPSAAPTYTPSPRPSPTQTRSPLPTLTPVPDCSTVPDVKFTYKITAPLDPQKRDVEFTILDGTENKETSCAYEGIRINADYVLIRQTMRTIDEILKKTPEDWDFVRQYVGVIQHDESYRKAGASFGNNGRNTIYITKSGVFEVIADKDELLYDMINEAGRFVHEADQIRMIRNDSSILNNIKQLLIKSDEREIAYLQKWVSFPGVSVLISNKYREIENCKNGVLPICNQ